MGLIFVVTYILWVPRQYEAIAQIKMAQISITNLTNPFGTLVENPASLISRMQLPTNYDSVVIRACDYQDKQNPALALSKSLKLLALKGVDDTVNLKAYGSSPETAKNYAQVVVNLITRLQAQFATPFVEEAKLKLAQNNERIESVRRLISKSDHSSQVISLAYLFARDELGYLLVDREKMLDLINSVKSRGTRLDAPVYASDEPVSPKKAISLVAGLLGGLFLGLLIPLGRQGLRKLKSEARGAL